MPRRTEDLNVEATPHFDGAKEGIINDTTASAGSMIGIQLDTKGAFQQEGDPQSRITQEDPKMKECAKIMDGKRITNQAELERR